jgi:hypothetical protein
VSGQQQRWSVGYTNTKQKREAIEQTEIGNDEKTAGARLQFRGNARLRALNTLAQLSLRASWYKKEKDMQHGE